ncbi:MAG: helix-turn-helix transcriptional regulator [Planctomycetaceae bacterium]|nr:helix-turn-helix transcriptional regulator [Planctomycetaceae bacterium]MCB9950986.1 helix-turn-helix transcriptional regulator [Planctomycetaceae bacterium]
MARKQRSPLSDQLRTLIRESGITRYKIWRDTGVSQSLLSKFMSGAQGLSLEKIDVLCEYLALKLARDEER